MKIALVCDWLTTFGGAEQVLLELHKMFPEAPIYTSQAAMLPQFQDAKIIRAWWGWLPGRLRNILTPLRMRYFTRLDLTEYDLVISSAMAEAKALRARRHLCYLNGIPRYYWSEEKASSPLINAAVRRLRPRLRRLDFAAAQQPTKLIANSRRMEALAANHYKRQSEVVFPPVSPVPTAKKLVTGEPFYLVLARQEAWKNIDLVVKVCRSTDRRLVLIGDGREHRKLKKLAGDNPRISFQKNASRAEIGDYLRAARALIQASDEPFGIAPVEALLAGTPVLALRAGGALDYVKEGQNGYFFAQPTTRSLEEALRAFETSPLARPSAQQRITIQASARPFSTAAFRRQIQRLIQAD